MSHLLVRLRLIRCLLLKMLYLPNDVQKGRKTKLKEKQSGSGQNKWRGKVIFVPASSFSEDAKKADDSALFEPV